MKNFKELILVFMALAVLTVALALLPGQLNAGDLEPTAPPGPTMKTLDQIPPTWSQILPADERFEVVMNGEAVLDKETGLVWEQSPVIRRFNFSSACLDCYAKAIGNRKGWRLPTVEELASLLDISQQDPALPSNHPFNNVQTAIGMAYWSKTTNDANNSYAWWVNFRNGQMGSALKTVEVYYWCVRGGNGHDSY